MTQELRANLPPLPIRMRSLPLDHRGFPVPFFVARINGEPDFRVMDPDKMGRCVRNNLCWVCGQPKGTFHAFVIGPMCAVNRTISEPPSHIECAVFSATACPFLSQPRMKRNEKDMPDAVQDAPGLGLKRNPGAACVWLTRSYSLMPVDNGVLFRLGEPVRVEWYCRGRRATRAEVWESIESGLPSLREVAEQDGPESLAALDRYVDRVIPLLPEK